jgi:DNA-binding response OmpR family regulator
MAVRDRTAIRPVFVPRPRADTVADPSGLVLDELTGEASYEGRRISLSARQFDLLVVLVGNAGRLVTPQELALHAWGERMNSSETVRSAIKAVRARLGCAGVPVERLVTVWGLGYRWDRASIDNSSRVVEMAS